MISLITTCAFEERPAASASVATRCFTTVTNCFTKRVAAFQGFLFEPKSEESNCVSFHRPLQRVIRTRRDGPVHFHPVPEIDGTLRHYDLTRSGAGDI